MTPRFRRTAAALLSLASLALSPPQDEEGRAKYVILVVGDGMPLACEIAASRYMHGTDRGLAHHTFPVQALCTTWDVTCYDRYTRARNAAKYAPGSYDPLIGYDPARGGALTYNGTWTPPSENYFFKPLDLWGAPAGKKKKVPATDSASSATALSCGVKTDDGNIAWSPGDPAGGALASITDRARARKRAAFGAVTTVPLSHATPAAFIAHNVDRDNFSAITAEAIHKTRPDVLIGAGHPATTMAFTWIKEEEYCIGSFVKSKAGDFYECTTAGTSGKTIPKWNPDLGGTTTDGTVAWTRRPSGANYTFIGKADYEGLAAVKAAPYDEYRFVERIPGKDGAAALDAAVSRILAGEAGGKRLFGLFGGRRRHMLAPAPDDEPGRPSFTRFGVEDPPLAACATAALKILTHRGGSNGFFLLVEAGDIDWANHERDYSWMVGAMFQFEETVRAVLSFIEDPSTPQTWENTLLIVTADHANSGLRFAPDVRLGKGDLPKQVIPVKTAPKDAGTSEADPATAAVPVDPDENRKTPTYPDKEIRYGAPGYHTNEPVTVYAKGTGSALIREYEGRWYPGTKLIDNTHLYEVMRRAMGLAP